MGIQEELKNAIEAGRDEVVGVLADHRVLPVVVEDAQSSDLLGGSKTPDFEFERRAGDEDKGEHVADRQTRRLVVDTLGLTSADDCESVRDEIRDHDRW
jgi:hypothetical protein